MTRGPLALRRPFGLMTHVVAGWPDADGCRSLLASMASRADVIEVQIPFSDPMADGPVILQANQEALDAGTRVNDAFALIREAAASTGVPVLAMTYANIPYRMGAARFADALAASGAAGVILPDWPVPEDPRDEAGASLPAAIRERGLWWVPVVSPLAPDAPALSRLAPVLGAGTGFVYTTLKIGVTGKDARDEKSGQDWLAVLRRKTDLPIAAGFGLRSAAQVAALRGKADVAVVGSELIRRVRAGGLSAAVALLDELNAAL